MPSMKSFLGIGAMVALCGLGACSSPSGGGSSATPVAVTDVRSVAGKWAGLVDALGPRSDDQYIEVTVREDGTYRATAARTIGFMDAQGRLQPSDGRLLVLGDSGSRGTAVLLTRDGGPLLQVEVTNAAGTRRTARLRPQP